MVFFFSLLQSANEQGGWGGVEAETSGGATRCSYPSLSAHNQQRKEQRERPQWLPDEQQDSSNVLMFPYDQNMDLLSSFSFSVWLIIEIIGRFCHRNH